MVAIIPLVTPPFKRPAGTNWVKPLKRYIQKVYQEDPEQYNEEIQTFQQLCQNISDAGIDTRGLELLYKYYGQLEFMELHFPATEKHVELSFHWYGAFESGFLISKSSIGFEIASLLYNMATTLSFMASSQDRSIADGRKRAFHFLQVSAGMFQNIRENILNVPGIVSFDLEKGTAQMLSDLMLAQAQECFLENSLCENNTSGVMISKLANQTAWVYEKLVMDISKKQEENKKEILEEWALLCQCKVKYYQALSQRYKGLACEADSKFGELVSRMSLAEIASKEAITLATLLAKNKKKNSGDDTTLSKNSKESLESVCKSLSSQCTKKLATVTKENDMVYHDPIPSTLDSIDRLNAVKIIHMTDLYGGIEKLKTIIGPDLFARLIPLSIHESASAYSEEKSRLIRMEMERCDVAKAELNATLDYMKLPSSLNKFKQNIVTAFDDNDDLVLPTDEMRQNANLIYEAEETENITDLIRKLDYIKTNIRSELDKVNSDLRQESRQYDEFHYKYKERWTQRSSDSLTMDFYQDIKNYREALTNGDQSDQRLLTHLEHVSQDLGVLRQGRNSDALDILFAESIITNTEEKEKKSDSVFDFDTGVNNKSLETKVKKVEDLVEKLYSIQKERSEALDSLKLKISQDDISQLLIFKRKDNTQSEQQIFSNELEKYKVYQQTINTKLHHQQQVIQELTTSYRELMKLKDAQRIQSRWDSIEKQKKLLIDRLKNCKSVYFEVKQGLSKGIQFYKDIFNVIESLERNVDTFIKSRQTEGMSLSQQLERINKEEKEQKILAETFERYAVIGSEPGIGSSYNQDRIVSPLPGPQYVNIPSFENPTINQLNYPTPTNVLYSATHQPIILTSTYPPISSISMAAVTSNTYPVVTSNAIYPTAASTSSITTYPVTNTSSTTHHFPVLNNTYSVPPPPPPGNIHTAVHYSAVPTLNHNNNTSSMHTNYSFPSNSNSSVGHRGLSENVFVNQGTGSYLQGPTVGGRNDSKLQLGRNPPNPPSTFPTPAPLPLQQPRQQTPLPSKLIPPPLPSKQPPMIPQKPPYLPPPLPSPSVFNHDNNNRYQPYLMNQPTFVQYPNPPLLLQPSQLQPQQHNYSINNCKPPQPPRPTITKVDSQNSLLD